MLEPICEFTYFENYKVYKSNRFPKFYTGNGIEILNPEGKDLSEWKDIFNKQFDSNVFEHITFIFERTKDHEYLIESARADKYDVQIESYMAVDNYTNCISIPGEYKISTINNSPDDWNKFEKFYDEVSKVYEWYDPNVKSNSLYEKTKETILSLGMKLYYISYHGTSEILASLGIFECQGLYSFQEVMTHPLHRRKSLATYLISYVILKAFTELNAKSLALVADIDYHAFDLYKKLGFKEYGQGVCLMKYPPNFGISSRS
ncbi:MAG: GNAT family N-acetyltransferase [Ignavibacteria bacterium]|nr:GNAT family N-acetyltransferase [Ignavibacteria bacterium]